jgi:hypothetical protein
MHTGAIINGDRQITQVGLDLRDYVLRYTVGDYDCYYRARYIGSRPTLAKTIEAVEEEQAKAARHPQLSLPADATMAEYQDELRAITAHLHDLANRMANHSAAEMTTRAQLMVHIRISQALRTVQDAERSLGSSGI